LIPVLFWYRYLYVAQVISYAVAGGTFLLQVSFVHSTVVLKCKRKSKFIRFAGSEVSHHNTVESRIAGTGISKCRVEFTILATAMKKILFSILFLFLLTLAYFRKPDDKTCIIAAVEAVWGSRTPDKNKFPDYFEQFMNVTAPSVEVNNWVFLKRIRYQYGKEKKTIGYGLFKRVYIL